MSNFIHPAFDPAAGVVREATWMDNYFGAHIYGVQFDAGGTVYRTEQVGIDACAAVLADLRSKLAAAEDKIVWGFYENRVPQYIQGPAGMHELTSPITAEEANQWVKQLVVAEARWRQEKDDLLAREAQLREALEIIAGKRQCIDNLMGNADIAEWALKHTQPSDYRERVRREAFEEAAKVCEEGDFDSEMKIYGRAFAELIRALGDSNADE